MPKRRNLRLAEKTKGLEEVKGQEEEEREVKRPKIDEIGSSETTICALDFNPFLVEPILRKLLTKVDKVAQLKELRKMCVLWDNVNMEELEERAFKGKFKAIDFEWVNRFTTKEEAQKELVEFLEDTRLIPILFRSFKFNIPESLNILQDHTSAIFSDYPIYEVELITPHYRFFKEFQIGFKYFLSLVGPNLKVIKICQPTRNGHESFEPKSQKWPKPQQERVLPKLEKLVIENKCWNVQITEFFKSTLCIGNAHMTSLPGADIGSFPGLDPTRMTHLDIGGRFVQGFENSSTALKIITGLMTLVKKGMRLLELGLKFGLGNADTPASFSQNLPTLCSKMTHFFTSQSSTLTTLNLQMEFYCTWRGSEDEIGAEITTYGKIKLPIFQALHTLSFGHRLKIEIQNQDKTLAYSLFETTHSLPLHFPSLINVTFESEGSMAFFFDNSHPMEIAGDSQFHFKSLVIKRPEYLFDDIEGWNKESRGNWNMLYGSLIGSVEILRVHRVVLEQVRIPWGDSLRELNIEHVFAPIKLAHLKKLKVLQIVIKDYLRVHNKRNVRDFLSWFKEAKQLSLTYIKFFGLEEGEKGVKEEIIRYFPYPVIFDNGKR